MSAKDSIITQTYEFSQEEFNDFLALYPVPSEYRVILPKSNQTVFDALPGYVGLYTHSFSLANLRLPLTEFFCELMVVSPQSTSSEGSLICVELQNKLDLKSFKDKLPPNNEENPMFQCLSRYPTSVRVFPDPIFFLAGLKPSWEHGQQRPAIMAGGKEMAFRNFIYTEDDEDLSFLPKEHSPNFGVSSPSVSVNTEPLKSNEEPEIQPVEVRADSGGSPKPELFVVHPLASGSSTSRATRAKPYSLKDDAPFLTVFDDDEGLPDVLELKDANAFHLKISTITPLTWKNHLDNHIDLELLDLHDRCYARQAVVDNAMNRRSYELLQVIEKIKGECDVMRSRERAKDEEYEGLRVKCEAALTDFEKNPAVKWAGYQKSLSTLESKVTALETKKARLEVIEVSLRKEVEKFKQDRREVVSKVVPYVVMELVHSDEMGSLVGKLVSSAIVYGRCRAFEQVADMKEPFDLLKVKGHRSSYKKDHTQSNTDLATSTFPWLNKWRIPQLLSKPY
ncbi:hypothetical protein Tco_1125904 [Tanacetum coccineum]